MSHGFRAADFEDFPIICLWELYVAMAIQVSIWSVAKRYEAFPQLIMDKLKFDQDRPSGLLDILVWNVNVRCWLTIDDWASQYYKLTLWAYGSGELKRNPTHSLQQLQLVTTTYLYLLTCLSERLSQHVSKTSHFSKSIASTGKHVLSKHVLGRKRWFDHVKLEIILTLLFF